MLLRFLPGGDRPAPFCLILPPMLTTLLLDEGSPILFAMYIMLAGTVGLFLVLLIVATRAAVPRLLRIVISLLLWALYLIVLWEVWPYLSLYPSFGVLPFIGFGLCCYASYRAVAARHLSN